MKKRIFTYLVFILPPLLLLCWVLGFFMQIRSTCRIQGNTSPLRTVNLIQEIEKIKRENKEYKRLEESTYLTFPEWFIVYSAVEYGRYLETHAPSGFPYFTSIGQYWCGYSYMADATKGYEFNRADHVVLMVIGTSYSVEYFLKGVYENVVGFYFEILNNRVPTQEDLYAQKVATEYGQWLYTVPWYDFPFFEKLKGLWRDTDLLGIRMPRKMERKFVLTLEYGIKGLYGKALGMATHATYTPAEENILLWTDTLTRDQIAAHKKISVVSTLSDGSMVISMPRYQFFSDTTLQLARIGVKIHEIGGNENIFLTAIAPTTWIITPEIGQQVFSMPILTDRTKNRVGITVQVNQLHLTVPALERNGVTIEHLYDY